MAKLYFKYGAMNSGKTTTLLQSIYNYEEQGMKVVLLKPKVDKKGEDEIVARIGLKRKVDVLINDNDDIFKIISEKYKNVNCVFVDESQFITFMQADELLKVAALLDIPVICYGIRTDFLMNGFIGSSRLLQIADKIEEIKTICKCGKKATVNVRMANGKYIFSGNQVAIDGFDDVTYVSMCPKCYFNLKN